MGIFGLFNKEVMYFPGCISSAFLKPQVENYKNILKKIGLSFETVKNEDFVCCGGILEQAGYEKQLRKLAKENASFLEQKKIKKIITNCPLCFLTLKKYKEMFPNFNIEVEFLVSSVLNALRENEKLVKTSFYEPIIYYDSCLLGRYEKYLEQPRELLRLFGYNVLEITNYNREETLCCGSCGNLPITNPELSEEIALNFLKKLLKMKIKKIVTADSQAYYYLKKIMKKYNLVGIQLLELSEVICDSLDIEKTEEEIEDKETKEDQEVKDIVGEK